MRENEASGAVPSADTDLTFQVIALEMVDSTNDEARRLAQAGAACGTVVWAKCQVAGRGRRGRSWQSDSGNLFLSIVVRPECNPAVSAQLSLVAAVAVVDAVRGCLPEPLRAQLKWPNDALIGGRKVAGILVECDPEAGGATSWAIIGIGINIRHCPKDAAYPVTDLLREGAGDRDAESVLGLVLERFGCWYRVWQSGGFAPVRTAWLERAVGIGMPIGVRLHNETVLGCFSGLDDDGVLLVAPAVGAECRRITAGDVFFPWLNGMAGAPLPFPLLPS